MIHERKDKLNFIKVLKFGSLESTVKKMKKQATDQEKYVQIICLIKDLYPKYTKN